MPRLRSITIHLRVPGVDNTNLALTLERLSRSLVPMPNVDDMTIHEQASPSFGRFAPLLRPLVSRNVRFVHRSFDSGDLACREIP